MTKVKRTKRIEIAVTPDEYQALQERKTKARLAEWLRELALNEKPRIVKTIAPELLFELNRIGVNLNQLARHCNSTSQSKIDYLSLLLALERIEQELKRVVECL